MQVRTTKPEAGNKFYITKAKGGYSTCIQGKPTDECDVLANCVGYASSRFNEIIGTYKYTTLNCNAENFIERAKSAGLKISDIPALGGIMVWQKGATLSGTDGAGHVAVVEKIIDANTIYTSESGYNSKAFWNATRTRGNGNWGQASTYKYRGCIVNPAINEENSTTIPEETTTSFKVGDIVVPITLVNYNGTHLRQYDKYYTITSLKGDRAVLSANRNGKMEIWAAMNVNNIKLYK